MLDKFLNSITMYHLTFYVLIAFVVLAGLLGLVGLLPYSPLDIAISVATAICASYVANYFFAKLFHAVTNKESVFITALILTLIIPVKMPQSFPFIVGASVIAMGVKYFVTVQKRHLFNPAAAAVAAIAMLSPEHTAIWWIGTPVMVPFVIIGGLLIVRKIRREDMVIMFLIVYAVLVIVFAFIHIGTLTSLISSLETGALKSALFFFAFIMFTEPLTSPPTKKLQRVYAALVAVLYATPQMRLFGIAFTPEVALCLGNIFSFFVSPQYRLVLSLREKIQMTADTFAFMFNKVNAFQFVPGQYMEWTLPHEHADSRGNRRYFSLASSPTEASPMITVKFYTPSSSYKRMLLGMKPGDEIIASQLAGDFVLPKDLSKPLAFIAGGVGIAPFRSMIQYVVDNKLSTNIVLLFANRHLDDIIFADLLDKACDFGVTTYYTLTDRTAIPEGWQGFSGHITAEMIVRGIPDYNRRTFYISGPQLMVQQTDDVLRDMGISRRNIKTDFFPGYKENK